MTRRQPPVLTRLHAAYNGVLHADDKTEALIAKATLPRHGTSWTWCCPCCNLFNIYRSWHGAWGAAQTHAQVCHPRGVTS